MARRAWLSVAALLAASGCSLLVDTDVGVRTDGGPGADGSAGKPDGGSGDPVCGTFGRFQDDFPGPELSGLWLTEQQGTYVDAPEVVGGRLQIAYHAGVAQDASELSVAYTHFAYDLRGSTISVRVDSVDGDWSSNLLVGDPGYNKPQLGIGTAGAYLTAWKRVDLVNDPVAFASDPYDPEIHRYWRIGEAGGAVDIETAGEDQNFTLFAHLADPGFALDNAYAAIEVWDGGASSAEGVIEFDDATGGPVATPACPIADFADDFTTPALGPWWVDRSQNCLVETGDGGLTTTVSSTNHCDLASAKAYSIASGGSLAVEIAQFPGDGGKLELHVTDADSDRVLMRQLNGVLRAELMTAGTTTDDAERANVVDHQWWRVRESSGDLVVETSDDGSAYDPVATFDGAAIQLGEVRAIVYLGATTGTIYSKIGGVNQAP